ncbi:hypothetical protein [Caballeronia cordobensis]|uniref:hypothetical protein n=1 Tax=Caballeronia cordobensis TaxID=1353886 RepID=UPI000A9FCC68
MDFAEKMRSLKDEFDLAVSVFLTDYLNLKEAAREELNGLFNEADYPTLAELATKFGVKMAVLPFPDASQFGVELPANVLTTLKSELDQHVMASIATANEDLVRRLYEAVSQMANRLYATGNVRLDVANNVRELCALLPKLNFANDPQLTHILEQAKTHLAVHTGAELKDSRVLRSQVASKALEIESWACSRSRWKSNRPVQANCASSRKGASWTAPMLYWAVARSIRALPASEPNWCSRNPSSGRSRSD